MTGDLNLNWQFAESDACQGGACSRTGPCHHCTSPRGSRRRSRAARSGRAAGSAGARGRGAPRARPARPCRWSSRARPSRGTAAGCCRAPTAPSPRRGTAGMGALNLKGEFSFTNMFGPLGVTMAKLRGRLLNQSYQTKVTVVRLAVCRGTVTQEAKSFVDWNAGNTSKCCTTKCGLVPFIS